MCLPKSAAPTANGTWASRSNCSLVSRPSRPGIIVSTSGRTGTSLPVGCSGRLKAPPATGVAIATLIWVWPHEPRHPLDAQVGVNERHYASLWLDWTNLHLAAIG